MSKMKRFVNNGMSQMKGMFSPNMAQAQQPKRQSDQRKTDKPWLDLQFNDSNGTSIRKPDQLEDEMEEPKGPIDEQILDRIQGSMVGMALGDALGAHVEFRPHQYMVQNPVKDLEGGGTWGLQKGQFTDDTTMALCLANSLVIHKNYNPYDQLVRYRWWHKKGYMSSTGECFDIGAATSQSLDEFGHRQTRFAKQHNLVPEEMDYLSNQELLNKFDVYCSEPGTAGNGALMRLAPVPLFFYRFPEYAVEYSGRSGQITHGDIKAYDACRYYGALIAAAVSGCSKDQLLDKNFYSKHKRWFMGKPLCAEIQSIAEGSYQKPGGYKDGIRGKGYIVGALEAALWAFWSDENSFEKGALAAVNLGDDTDTTAAIYGQLAGAYYGYKNLPERWIKQLYAKKFIVNLSKWIVYEGNKWQPLENIFSSGPNLPVQPAPHETNTEPIVQYDHSGRVVKSPDYQEKPPAANDLHRKKNPPALPGNTQNQPGSLPLPTPNRGSFSPNHTDPQFVYPPQHVDPNTKLTLRKSNSNKQPSMIQTSVFPPNGSQYYDTPFLENNQYGQTLRATQSIASSGPYVPPPVRIKNQPPPIYDDKSANIISGTSAYIPSDNSSSKKTSSNSNSSRNASLTISPGIPEYPPITTAPKKSSSRSRTKITSLLSSRKAKSPVSQTQMVSPNSNGINGLVPPPNNNDNLRVTGQVYNDQAYGYQNNSPQPASRSHKTKSSSSKTQSAVKTSKSRDLHQ